MLCIIRTKGCKCCGGDLSLECDIYGVYAECIQCGANWSESAITCAGTQSENQRQEAKEVSKVSAVVSDQ